MKNRYRVFRRGWGNYYCEELVTKKQESLETRHKDESYRIVAAKNETEETPAFSLHLARVYWQAGDQAVGKRTWQNVMDEIPKLRQGETKHRWETAIKDKAFDSIRNLVVLETRAGHFLKVLQEGSVSTKVYLRRIHNSALDMNWQPWPVLTFRAAKHHIWSLKTGSLRLVGRLTSTKLIKSIPSLAYSFRWAQFYIPPQILSESSCKFFYSGVETLLRRNACNKNASARLIGSSSEADMKARQNRGSGQRLMGHQGCLGELSLTLSGHHFFHA